MKKNTIKLHNKVTGRVKYVDEQYRPISKNLIKADIILDAWLSYCRESRTFRLLQFLKLR